MPLRSAGKFGSVVNAQVVSSKSMCDVPLCGHGVEVVIGDAGRGEWVIGMRGGASGVGS